MIESLGACMCVYLWWDLCGGTLEHSSPATLSVYTERLDQWSSLSTSAWTCDELLVCTHTMTQTTQLHTAVTDVRSEP